MKKSVIPISALLVLATMTLADVQEKHSLPSTREWLGYIVVFTFLSAGSDLGLEFTNGLALLVLMTMLLVRGPDAYGFLNTKFQRRRGKSVIKNTPKPEKSGKPATWAEIEKQDEEGFHSSNIPSSTVRG